MVGNPQTFEFHKPVQGGPRFGQGGRAGAELRQPAGTPVV